MDYNTVWWITIQSGGKCLKEIEEVKKTKEVEHYAINTVHIYNILEKDTEREIMSIHTPLILAAPSQVRDGLEN